MILDSYKKYVGACLSHIKTAINGWCWWCVQWTGMTENIVATIISNGDFLSKNVSSFTIKAMIKTEKLHILCKSLLMSSLLLLSQHKLVMNNSKKVIMFWICVPIAYLTLNFILILNMCFIFVFVSFVAWASVLHLLNSTKFANANKQTSTAEKKMTKKNKNVLRFFLCVFPCCVAFRIALTSFLKFHLIKYNLIGLV